jgi:hypothetical protein
MPNNPSATGIAATDLLKALYTASPATTTAAVNAWWDGRDCPVDRAAATAWLALQELDQATQLEPGPAGIRSRPGAARRRQMRARHVTSGNTRTRARRPRDDSGVTRSARLDLVAARQPRGG